jgi:hypothetical protein
VKVDNLFNIVGAAFMLAAIGMIVARPQIVRDALGGITNVITAATLPVRGVTNKGFGP